MVEGTGAAVVVAAIDHHFPDRRDLVLRPSHAPKVTAILGLLERVPEVELAAVPDVLLGRIPQATEELRAYVRAWETAGERERRLLAEPSFGSAPLEALREAFAAAAAATSRQRDLTAGLFHFLRELESFRSAPYEESQERLYRWADNVSAWLRRELGEQEVERFDQRVGTLERAAEECRAFLVALRDDIAAHPENFTSVPQASRGPIQAPAQGAVNLREALERLKAGLLSTATSGEMMPTPEYKALRRLVIDSPLIGQRAPGFLKSCPTPEEFRAHMQALGGYVERRRIIGEAINPILESLESGAALGSAALEVGPRLGEGGFGEVFKARHKLLERDFAIKIFSPSFSQGEAEPLHRFFQEARMLFDLNHPNIVRVYDVGMIGGKAFIQMEFIDGATLTARLERGVMSPKDALSVVRGVADALRHAHEDVRVVHRDLKPSNIMITSNGRVVVLDFGLGIYIESEIASRITKTGARAAAGLYTAPELEADPRLVDPRSDIYSLGAIWYTLLIGRAPAAGQNIRERLQEVPGVTSAYAAAVVRCLDDLDRRFGSVGELLAALDDLPLPDGAIGDDAPAEPSDKSEDPVPTEEALAVLEALRRDEVSRVPAARGDASLLPVALAAIGERATDVLEELNQYEYIEFTGPAFRGHLTGKGKLAVKDVPDPAEAPLTGDALELMRALKATWHAMPPRSQKEPFGLLGIAVSTLGPERGPKALRYLSDYGHVHCTTSGGHDGVITHRGHEASS
jgi:serine/threonine-protein kinase